MPTSAREGRDFFTEGLKYRNVESVVDFGPGEGTYSILGRHLTPNWTTWTAVEIFAPYVERYDLDQKYDTVIVGDLQSYPTEPYSIGIFGDVLEHLSEEAAIFALERHAELASHLSVSVPINPAPQGPSHGNGAEAHLHDWTFDAMYDRLSSLGNVQSWRGAIVGRWWVDL